MTCEDCEELNGPSTLENAAHKITLLASPPDPRTGAGMLRA